jgi:hypothetical protein
MSKHELRTFGAADDEDLSDVGGFSDVGENENGEVDMFGLDEFGQVSGADSMWGAVIGGGLGTGAAIVTRAMTKPTSRIHQFSEGIGLLAGGIAGGVMMAFPNSRRMGWAAIATAFVTNGLRQMENMLFAPKFTVAELEKMLAAAQKNGGTAQAPGNGDKPGEEPVTTPDATYGGWRGVDIEPTAVIQPFQGFGQDIDVSEVDGFGIATIGPGYAVDGLGEAVIDPAYPIPGSISGFGMSRPELVGPPTLMNAGDYGMSDNPAVTQTQLLGGPAISGLAGHFGATLYGGGS